MSRPVTPLEAAGRLREEADRRIAGRLAALPRGGAELPCREGCAACCRQLVVVSPLEALAIAEHVAARPALAAGTAERRARWEAGVAAHPGLAEALERLEAANGYLPAAEGGVLEVEYWRARVPCPFLDAGRCAIYPVRPFSCREHAVLSDPRLCEEDPDRVTDAGTRLLFRAVASRVGQECFGLPDRLIPLPRALEAAEGEAAAAGREVPEERFEAATETAQRQVRVAQARLALALRARDVGPSGGAPSG